MTYLDVTIYNDNVVEINETFEVQLTVAPGLDRSLSVNGSAEITIIDNDRVVVGFEPSVATVFESEGSTLICIAVDSLLSCPIEFSFNFTLLVDGQTNFVGTFGMCETRTCFTVSIEDDIVIEGTKVLHVSLEAPPDLLGKIDFRDGNITVMDDDDFTLCLVDGEEVKANETYGLVEVWRSEWRLICDDYWTDEDANVVCRELGFLGFGASVILKGQFEERKDMKYWLDDVQCKGNESSVSECPHRGWGVHNCGQGERAGVNCLKKSDVVMRLSNNDSGIIELNFRGEWCAICGTHWTGNDARVVCRKLGFPEGIDPRARVYTTVEEVNYCIDFVNCKGDEENMLSCDYVGSGKNSGHCESGRAGVTCIPSK